MHLNRPVRMAILDMNNNEENMGIDSIRRIAGRFPEIGYEVFDVRHKFELPGLDFDIYISSGGPGDPLEADSRWDKAYYELLDDIWQHNQYREDKKYVFFICHSFQMACRHFGVGQITERHKESFGIVPVNKTETGESCSVLDPLDDPFFAADFRRFQVVHPDLAYMRRMGMEITAMESPEDDVEFELALMAVRFSDEMYGTQFHPEAHPDGMVYYLNRADKRDMILSRYGKEVYDTMMHNALDPGRLTATRDHILPGFIRSAADSVMAFSDASPVLI
jgi:GMP synthase-like glutamine amidotransferase